MAKLTEEEAEEAIKCLDEQISYGNCNFFSLRQEIGLRYPHLAGGGLPVRLSLFSSLLIVCSHQRHRTHALD